MALDLAAIAILALAAAAGASSGALHQLVQLAGMVVGWLAAWHLGAPVARGISRWLPEGTARGAAGLLLFVGFSILAAWVGHLFLATKGMSGTVRAPPDRGAGALLGGAKAGLVLWIALSALVLAGGRISFGRYALDRAGSDLAALAEEHNLLVRWRPAADRALERLGGGGLRDRFVGGEEPSPAPATPAPKAPPKPVPRSPTAPVKKGSPRAR
jgi:membrane protein required for colicin V production